MVTVYNLDDMDLSLSGFKDVSENDFPKHLYYNLYQTLFNITGKKVKGKLMFNEKNHLFALIHDGICIIDEDDNDGEEFIEDLLFAD